MSEAESLLHEADEKFRAREITEARALYKQAVEAAKKNAAANDPRETSLRIEALAQIARTHLTIGEKDQGRPWLEEAAKRVDRESHPRAWARYLGVRGRFEWKDNQLEIATQTFTEMYDFALAHELFTHAIDAAQMAAITAPPEDRVEWAHRGIEAAETGHDSSRLGPLWNNLGWTHDEMGDHDQALEALLKAREYHHQGKRELPKLIADYSVGVQYRKLSEVESALQWQQPTMESAERLYANDPSPAHAEWVGFTHHELGEIALLRNNRDAARDHFTVAIDKLREAAMPEWDAAGFAKIEARLERLR